MNNFSWRNECAQIWRQVARKRERNGDIAGAKTAAAASVILADAFLVSEGKPTTSY